MKLRTFSAALFGVLAICLNMPVYSVGFGTEGGADAISELTLHQVGIPAEVLTPPYRITRDAGLITNPSERNIDGVIYAQHLNNARIDFLISGIRNDIPVDVFLAYSTRPGDGADIPMGFSGKLSLDTPTMQVIAGMYAAPVQHFLQQEPTPLGAVSMNTRAITLSIWLSDLRAPQFQSDELFFQAIAVPAGTLNLNDAQASEVDHFFINRHTVRAIRPLE